MNIERDCGACNKSKDIHCFNDEPGCWYTRTKEESRQPTPFHHKRGIDYSSIRLITSEERTAAKLESARIKVNEYISRPGASESRTNIVTDEQYKKFGKKPVGESATRARLEAHMTKHDTQPCEPRTYEEGELDNYKYQFKSTEFGYTTEECFEGLTNPPSNPDYNETLDCRMHIRATVFYDADKLADRMPGRNNGYFKYGVKPKCPVCNITVDEYGYCPECLERVIRVHNVRGNVIAIYAKNKNRYYYEPRDYCEYITKDDEGKTVTIDSKNYMNVTEWINPDVISKFNFYGKVHKKSCGRAIREGNLSPDPEVNEFFAHDVSIKIEPIVTPRPDEEQYGDVVEAVTKTPIIKMNKKLGTCPECDCNVKVKDLRRGDTVCPKCGLVYKQTLMIYESRSMGDDEGTTLADYVEV